MKTALAAAIVGLVTCASASAFEPTDIGNELWAWGWAGDQSEHLTLKKHGRGLCVMRMKDLSGRGHDFIGDQRSPPAYQQGLKWPANEKGGPYETQLPVIGLHKYAGGAQVYGNIFRFEEPLVAKGPFYIAAVCMNIRDNGLRELFGIDARFNVAFDQQRDFVVFRFDGKKHQLTDAGKLPAGIMYVEIWRDEQNRVHTWANGSDIGRSNVAIPGTLQLKGCGFDGEGQSQWDDYWMEFVLCDALPTKAEREALREYERKKWNIWSKK